MLPLLDRKAQMEASKEVKEAVDKSIALDCHKDLAWPVLGCWNQRLADIGMVKRTLARVFDGKVPDASNSSKRGWPCRTSVKTIPKASVVAARRCPHSRNN